MQFSIPNVGVYDIDDPPDRCPVCLNGIHPIETSQACVIGNWIERVFRCPRQLCGHFFVARYVATRVVTGLTFKLTELHPLTIKGSGQSEVITKVSPDFVAIFGEAETAEQRGLKLVCGPGYRKALEFLIKDYVIGSHQDKAEEIKRLNLAKCITDYVSNETVKQVAARAVWLGNDETHYLRKWEGKDLADLKGLIRLTVHWIEMDELTQQVLVDMPEGK
jgi:hypothetical protein